MQNKHKANQRLYKKNKKQKNKKTKNRLITNEKTKEQR